MINPKESKADLTNKFRTVRLDNQQDFQQKLIVRRKAAASGP